tara:strand:- start:95 stop:541 length:447 start_codon:yes stop_codon:yes gene_type:complete
LRPVRVEGAANIYAWRYAKTAEKYYQSRKKPSFDQHVLWLTSALQNTNHHLFIAEDRGRPVSHIKASFDLKEQKMARVGICTAPQEQGKGYGLKLLLVLHDFLRLIGSLSLIAEVHQENISSLILFENVGYRSISQSGNFCLYECKLT